jgi:hypothetical protein
LQHATCYLLPQALAFDEFHRNKHLTIDFIDRVDGANVGMIQRRCSLRLAEKAILLLAAQRDGREKLQRDDAFELGVLGFLPREITSLKSPWNSVVFYLTG